MSYSTKLFLTFFFLFLAVWAKATTYVGEHIEKDTKWNKDNSPYVVTIDLAIFKEATLEIEAGTKVYFSKETSLTVAGSIVARGSHRKEILFAGLRGDDWNGLLFTKECNDYNPETEAGCLFAYCTFEGTGETPAHVIRSKGCDINIENCSFTDCYTAIQTERQAEVWIRYSEFKDCNRVLNVRNTSFATVENNEMNACNSIMLGGTTYFRNNTLKKFTGRGRHSGIVVWMLGGGIVEIKGNEFLNFDDYAIKLYRMTRRSSFLVTKNDFKNNQTNITLSCKYFNKGKYKIAQNNFYNYKDYHIKLFAPCSDEENKTLNIGRNHWGKMDEEEVKNATLAKHSNQNLNVQVRVEESLERVNIK